VLNRRIVVPVRVPKRASSSMAAQPERHRNASRTTPQRGGKAATGVCKTAVGVDGAVAMCALCLRAAVHSDCPLKPLHASCMLTAQRAKCAPRLDASLVPTARSGSTGCGEATRHHRAVSVIAEVGSWGGVQTSAFKTARHVYTEAGLPPGFWASCLGWQITSEAVQRRARTRTHVGTTTPPPPRRRMWRRRRVR
jgi:hypothetical protein